MFRKIIKVERDMLITKGGVSFRGQPELLKWSGISSLGSGDLSISLISSSPCLSISVGKKINPPTVIQEVGGTGEQRGIAKINPVCKASGASWPRPRHASAPVPSPRVGMMLTHGPAHGQAAPPRAHQVRMCLPQQRRKVS